MAKAKVELNTKSEPGSQVCPEAAAKTQAALELHNKTLAFLVRLDQCVKSKEFQLMMATTAIEGRPFQGPWINDEVKSLVEAVKGFENAYGIAQKQN